MRPSTTSQRPGYLWRVASTPRLLLLALACLMMIESRMCDNYIVRALGASESSSPEAVQFVSMAQFAVDQVNARWPLDTLTLELSGTATSPVQLVSYYLNAAANADVLAVLGTGDDTLDSALSLVSAHANLPMIAFTSEANHFNSSGFPYVSMHSNTEFTFEALQTFFGQYNFHRIGVVYSVDDIELLSALRQYFASQNRTEFVSFLLPQSTASYGNTMDALIAQNIHVVVILGAEQELFDAVLEAADQSNLITEDKAWICFSPLEHVHWHNLPKGVMAVHESEASPDRLADFEVLLQSLDPVTYPGTGPGATLSDISILAYDMMNMVAAVVEEVQAATLPVNRANFLSFLRNIVYEGSSGTIAFDSYGSRKFGAVDFDISIGEHALSTFMSFNGTIQSHFNPTWPGDTITPPTTQLQILPVMVLSQMDHGLADESLVAPTMLAYTYAISRLNDMGVVPNGYHLKPYVFDHGDSNLAAVLGTASAASKAAIAEIGSSVSRLSVLSQAILGGVGIPQISHSTTEPDLSVKELFPTFMRVCNEAEVEAEVMLELIRYWGWDEVTVLDFESDVAPPFIEEAVESGVSILQHVILEVEGDETDFLEVFNEMAENEPRIVILLVGPENIRRALEALVVSELKPHALFFSYSFLFANLSRYAQVLNVPVERFNGWIVMNQPSGTGPVFESLLAELNLLNETEYPGVASIVAEAPVIQRAFEAALVIGDAVSRLVGAGGDPRNGSSLLESMLQTDLPGITGTITFTPEGDRTPLFSITNSQNGILVPIASWNETSGLLFSGTPVYWPDGTTDVPLDREPRKVTWLSWESPAGIILGVLAGLGLAFCCFVLIVIYLQRNSPVIMSSTWQFLILMIVGAIVGFSSVLIWVGEPNSARCATRVWFLPMALILIISPLLAKTWRLHRIFSLRDLKTNPIPLSRLVLMVTVMILIQVIICVFWISIGTVQTRLEDAQDDPKLAYLVCSSNKTNDIAQYVTYGYLGVLILVCCYLAFRVRKLPKDFNESRWIAVAIYNIFIFVVLLMILGYALRKFPITFQILLCVAIVIICLGSVSALMLPKLWELLMHPERRSSSSGSQGSTKAKTTNTSGNGTRSNGSKGDSHNASHHAPSYPRSNYSLASKPNSKDGSKTSSRDGTSPAASPKTPKKLAVNQAKREATPLSPSAPINSSELDRLDTSSSSSSSSSSFSEES